MLSLAMLTDQNKRLWLFISCLQLDASQCWLASLNSFHLEWARFMKLGPTDTMVSSSLLKGHRLWHIGGLVTLRHGAPVETDKEVVQNWDRYHYVANINSTFLQTLAFHPYTVLFPDVIDEIHLLRRYLIVINFIVIHKRLDNGLTNILYLPMSQMWKSGPMPI